MEVVDYLTSIRITQHPIRTTCSSVCLKSFRSWLARAAWQRWKQEVCLCQVDKVKVEQSARPMGMQDCSLLWDRIIALYGLLRGKESEFIWRHIAATWKEMVKMRACYILYDQIWHRNIDNLINRGKDNFLSLWQFLSTIKPHEEEACFKWLRFCLCSSCCIHCLQLPSSSVLSRVKTSLHPSQGWMNAFKYPRCSPFPLSSLHASLLIPFSLQIFPPPPPSLSIKKHLLLCILSPSLWLCWPPCASLFLFPQLRKHIWLD